MLATLLAAGIVHSSSNVNSLDLIKALSSGNSPLINFIPAEAIKYNGHHYHVFSDIGSSMDDAQQFCESIGGHLATVDDEEKNLRMYRLINASGYDNEAFEIPGQSRFIAGEPVAYEKVNPQDASSEDYYGMFYWNYQGSDESSPASGNAFVCEWDY